MRETASGRRQAPRHVASILDAARKFEIRDAQEEKGIRGNFPEDRQTADTTLLFLQLVMRKLRRRPTAAGRPARAAMVVPNGTLFGDGVCARIKEELLKEFNLHTIVRLPNGVFAPYTGIPTNLLFFDRSGPTKEVWYYEHPLPEGMYRHGFLGQPGECIHAAVVSANARRTTAGARKPSRSINHCWL